MLLRYIHHTGNVVCTQGCLQFLEDLHPFLITLWCWWRKWLDTSVDIDMTIGISIEFYIGIKICCIRTIGFICIFFNSLQLKDFLELSR